ncbi:MAG: oligosaccharide flippase family protein [Chloroflexi bacterium]|nr:oligosaccharide flippase family protein [Chloroflexota bacterium]
MNLIHRARQIGRLVAESRQSFSGRAGIVFVGSALGQGIAFLMLPLAARIYQADTLGRAATILSIVSISALVICLQYDQAVVVASDAELPYLLLLSSGIAMIWGVLLGAAILVDLNVAWPGGGHLLASWGVDWKLPLLMLTYAPFTLLTNLSLRRNHLSKVSVGRAIYYGGASVLQVVCGLWFGATESVFLLAQVVAACVAVSWLFPYRDTVTWVMGQLGIKRILAEIRRVAKSYVKFPQYQMGAGFVNAISIYVPIIFLRAAFSDAWAGWYFMAWRLLAAPLTLISQAIGQVFYRDSAERERSGIHQGRLLENVVFSLLRVVLLPAVVLGICAPFLVPYLLGQEWAPVAPIIQVLLISMVVSFFTSPVSMFLNVKSLQAGALAYNLVLFLGRVLALGVGWRLGSEIGSIAAYSVVSMVVLLSFCHYIVQSAEGSTSQIIRRALPLCVDVVLLMALAAFLWLTHVLYQPFGILAVGMAVCVAGWRDLRRGNWRARLQAGRTA